jgi:hypothetical protein
MTDMSQPEEQFGKIWQKVPQEERTNILTEAQSKATEVCGLLAIFSCAAAWGLHIPAIALGAAAFLPVLYQVVVTRAVLEIKPKTVARYLVASRTATQYAEALRSSDPTPKTLFRGILEPFPEPTEELNTDFAQEYAEEMKPAAPSQKEVWISLFPDTLVMFSENPTGAHLELSCPILDGLSVTMESSEDISGNPVPQRLIIESAHLPATKWALTSQHTSSLLACERKVRYFTQRAETPVAKKPLPAPSRDSHSLYASRQLGATLEAVSH